MRSPAFLFPRLAELTPADFDEIAADHEARAEALDDDGDTRGADEARWIAAWARGLATGK